MKQHYFDGFLAAGWVLMGLCAVGWGLGAAADEVKPAKAGDYTLSGPYTHDNLTIWLVHGADKVRGRKFMTLQEALDKKVVVVHETGDVNQLAIENVSPDHEVYVQSGDIVKGGKQDRTFSMDFIVPPHSGRMPVASFCVEQGRWTKRGKEEVANFSSSAYSLSGKSVKLAAKLAVASDQAAQADQPGQQAAQAAAPAAGPDAGANANPAQGQRQAQAQEQGRAQAERYGQGAVWNAVAQEQRKLSANIGQSVQAAESPSSYQLCLENPKLLEQTEAYVKKLSSAAEGKGDVIGYAFAINGKVNSVDVYASREVFAKLWPKLLRASAVEALSEMTRDGKFEAAKAEAVAACIADAEKGKQSTKAVTGRVEMVTRESKDNLLFETRDKQAKDGDEAWVHRNYVAK